VVAATDAARTAGTSKNFMLIVERLWIYSDEIMGVPGRIISRYLYNRPEAEAPPS
jgi:hypothetical protein